MNQERHDEQAELRSRYEPARYWTDRLDKDFSLRGVGHAGYSERYNEWIYRQKARTLARVLPPAAAGGRALDVGSGIGWVVERLLRAGWQVDGCDISEHVVERLGHSFTSSSFFPFALGAAAIPRADAEYDLVTMLDVSYHVVDDELWRRGLSDLARVLRPGGHLIVLDRFGSTDDDVAAHVRFRSLPRWDAAASAAGLQRELLIPAYRWLSRPHAEGPLRHLPSGLRGPVEFSLERLLPRAPHMRCVRYVRSPT